MAHWTDIIEPVELVGYARKSLEELESQGSLAQFLPNREVADTVVRFIAGQAGYTEAAQFRAFDAEPTIGKRPQGKRVVLELPPIGHNIPVSEAEQLKINNEAGDKSDAMRTSILRTTDQVVRAVANRIEQLRGIVINTGIATIPEVGAADDFGRDASHNVTAPTLWSDPAADRLAFLEQIMDLYRDTNGVEAGAILLGNKAFRALAGGEQFRLQLNNGASRPATDDDVRSIVTGAGLPNIIRYDRKVAGGKVLDESKLFMLPAPVEADAWQATELGATFWGQTLTSTHETYGLEFSEQPGIVAGVYRGEKPPLIAEVIADAIALPVLANANLSLSAKVL